MFKNVSIIWILVAAIVVAGVIPLVVIAATDNVVIGFVALAVVGLGTCWMANAQGVGKPLQQFMENTKQLESSIERELAFPKLDSVPVGIGKEFAVLNEQMQSVGKCFSETSN